jgi:hypothetical protein
VDLSGAFNNGGIAASRWPTSGGFNIWANTFPAEQLPAPGSTVPVGGVPFRFPGAPAGQPDNIRCRGQRIALPPGRYDWCYVLAAAERRTEDAVLLRYADGTAHRQWLRVSDFWPETPARFGELPAYRTDRMLYPRHAQHNMAAAIWRCRIPVSLPGTVVALDLPDNPAIHIFALTALGPAAPPSEMPAAPSSEPSPAAARPGAQSPINGGYAR